MRFAKISTAGSADSCDISIRIEASDSAENKVYLNSVVERQFGEHIKSLINEILSEYGLTGVVVSAVDKGAMDFTIRARMVTAIYRCADAVKEV